MSTGSAASLPASATARAIGEARELAYDGTYARRHALGRILRPRAQTIQDDTVGHALRATNYLGLGDAAAKRILDVVKVYIRDLLAAGFRHFAVKPLVSLGFRLALKDVRAHAAEKGVGAEELEDELRVFQRAFEARIIYRS